MYLRHTVRIKNGKRHVYWRLVRSVRRGRKVHQETVAQLGELDAQGRASAKLLARRMMGGRCEQRELFEDGPKAEVLPVRLDKISLERHRSFGDVWLAWVLWRALDLDRTFVKLLPLGDEAVPWSTMAAVLVIARLRITTLELIVNFAERRRVSRRGLKPPRNDRRT